MKRAILDVLEGYLLQDHTKYLLPIQPHLVHLSVDYARSKPSNLSGNIRGACPTILDMYEATICTYQTSTDTG